MARRSGSPAADWPDSAAGLVAISVRADPDNRIVAAYGRQVAGEMAAAYLAEMVSPVHELVRVEHRSELEWMILLRGEDSLGRELVDELLNSTGAYLVPHRGFDRFLDVRVGIAIADELPSVHSIPQLEQCADAALAGAIVLKRHAVLADDGLVARAAEEIRKFQRLAQATDADFRMYYQPIVRLATRETVGYEALLRWKTDDGVMTPGYFLEAFEETSLLWPVGRTVIADAVSELKRGIHKVLGDEGFVTINLSKRQLLDPDIVDLFRRAEDSGIDLQKVWIEVREDFVIRIESSAARTIEYLHDLGCRICIDDLGKGYSALSYVKDFPIDVLKIDNSLIAQVMTNDTDLAVVRAICDVANAVGIETVAEGIECEAVLPTLDKLGLDYGQGYYFGYPEPPEIAFGNDGPTVKPAI